MKIKYYGHAAFKITTDKGVRIILDPYESGAFGGALSYGKVTDEADIVLTSHDHEDHNYTKDIKGKFTQVKKEGTYELKGVKVSATPSYHDPSKGKERGNNLIFVIEADGLRVAHLGDLGHTLDKKTIEALGKVDVLLLPVGGLYTIDAKEAAKVMKDISPRVTIPMHYRTEKCNFPISPVDDFILGKKAVRTLAGPEIDVTKGVFPKEPEVVILKYAL
jgi:L-ascorbate metabolism protein UlaG (beta-lactamase superfamily)